MILGIDPGLNGALALYDPEADILCVEDMPTLELGKRVIDHYGVGRIVDAWSGRISQVWIESVGVRPGEGAVGAFAFGRGFGVLLGVCAGGFHKIELVTPSVWKRAMKVTGDKDESRARASALFPCHSALWARKKDEGRAEAALIALYGARQSITPQGAE